jgi:hypothetical protein
MRKERSSQMGEESNIETVFAIKLEEYAVG